VANHTQDQQHIARRDGEAEGCGDNSAPGPVAVAVLRRHRGSFFQRIPHNPSHCLHDNSAGGIARSLRDERVGVADDILRRYAIRSADLGRHSGQQ